MFVYYLVITNHNVFNVSTENAFLAFPEIVFYFKTHRFNNAIKTICSSAKILIRKVFPNDFL